MEPDSRYPLIGAVVLALALAMAMVFAWFSGDGAGNTRQFVIAFDRQSVEGLQMGSDVNMRGVKVGRVERFMIDADKINRVKVLVRVDGEVPVTESTEAVISRNFLTGLARIDLQTPDTAAPPLTEVPTGEKYPVIAEGTSGMDQIAESANRLALSGEKTLANLNRLMTEDNQQAFAQTLAATRDLAVGLNARLAAVDATLGNLDSAARAFVDSSRKVGSLAEQSGTAVTELRTLAVRGQATLDDSRTLLAEFGQLARTLDATARQLTPQLADTSDASLFALRATAQDLRRAAEALTQTLERLAEPRSALIGPVPQELGPGERRP